MRRAVFKGFGGTDQIAIVSAEPPGPAKGELLIHTAAAGLNPKDVLIRKGKFRRLTGSTFPQGIGFDYSGTVVEGGVGDFQPGDRVFGMINGWRGKTAAEYLTVDATGICRIPEGISFPEAAGVALAGQTALQALRDQGEARAGHRVLINGASGGVGTLAIQIAKAIGCTVVTVSSTKNTQLCLSLGADSALSYEDQGYLEAAGSFDVFFDVFGNKPFPRVRSMLSVTGNYVTTVPGMPIFREYLFNPFRRQKARMVYVKSKAADLAWLADRMREGVIRPVVDRIFPLEEIREAQAYIESKRATGKVILKMTETSPYRE